MKQPIRTRMKTSRLPQNMRTGSDGFGLLQAMLILLLVATALAAGAVLFQSKVKSQQAQSQEANLRWADEALVAFASAHSRLPCPANVIGGTEECGDIEGKWLPATTLASVHGAGVTPGPIAYRVRPKLSNISDTTFLGNTYQPVDAEGTIRNADAVDTPDESHQHFTAVNGLDFCQTLQDLSVSQKFSNTDEPSQALKAWAYGVAIPGPDSSSDRFDDHTTGNNPGSNDSTPFPMTAPSKQWSSAYDDRVRVRTIDGVAQSLGCRMLPNSITSIDRDTKDPLFGNGYYDTSHAGIDSLAMAVSLHDTLADLKDNNVGNAKLSVDDAKAAVVFSSMAMLLSAGQITDTISSNITDFVTLGTDIVGCIFTGITCPRIPTDASSIALEIGSIVANAVALGLNAGSLKPNNDALTLHNKALARANAANTPPPSSIEEALDEMELTLYGGNILTCNALPVLDEDGNQKKDAQGQLMYVYENECDKHPANGQIVHKVGLDVEVASAKIQLDRIKKHSDYLESQRLVYWNDANIHSRINTTGFMNQQYGRYVKDVWRCLPGTGTDAVYADYLCSTRSAADATTGYYWSLVKEFDWDKAKADAIAKRKIAEELARHDKRRVEIDEDLREKKEEISRWKDTIIPQMESQMKDECKGQPYTSYDVFNGNFDAMPFNVLKCVNAVAGIKFTKECKRKITVLEKNPATNKSEWKEKLVQEHLLSDKDENYNPHATCMPMMEKQLALVETEKKGLDTTIDRAEQAYRTAPAPLFNYPTDWPRGRVLETTTKDSNGIDIISYSWQLSEPGKPYYAPEPFGCSNSGFDCKGDVDPKTKVTGAPIWVANSELMLVPGKNSKEVADNCLKGAWLVAVVYAGYPSTTGTMCQRYPYSRAYADWLRANEASVSAEESYSTLKEQFDTLEQQYKELRKMNLIPGSGGTAAPTAVGAECILVLADNRGSVGGSNMSCTP